MPSVRLTTRGINAIKPPKAGRVEYWDTALTGLGLRVSETGRKSWVVMYRNQGRLRRMTLGTYPAKSLSAAREEASDILGRASKGKDPAAEKTAERKAGTFNELADLYIEKYAKGEKYTRWEAAGEKGEAPPPEKRSWRTMQAIINRDLKPAWGNRKAKAITKEDVNRLMDKIVERGAPIQANRVFEVVRQIYSWAIGKSRVAMPVNPCHEIKKPTAERPRKRVLDATEIKDFWPMAGASAKISDGTRFAIRLILATAQRPGEVTGLAWAELDRGWETTPEPFWTIPGTRTKNEITHRVPLSPLAVDLLKQVKKLEKAKAKKDKRPFSKYAFRSPYKDQPIYEGSLSHALIKSGHFGLEHFTPHDLRRSAATHMTGPPCRVARFILERVLNHKDLTVTGKHYDFYQYDEEKRHALSAWASRLTQIIEGTEAEDKVVQLHG